MTNPISKPAGLKCAHQFALTGRLKRAIGKQEFKLFYQPSVDLESGQVVGMESLLRWSLSHLLRMMPPSEFIPVAEESGLIVPLGEWVLKTACLQNKMWQKAGLPRLTVAVNLSGRQFHHQDLVEKVATALEESQLDPQCLDLEITETYAMQDADFTLAILRELKSLGVHISRRFWNRLLLAQCSEALSDRYP